ncbi:MAG: periplasmic-type flagellar collar protein FlbB [Treponema sp.]
MMRKGSFGRVIVLLLLIIILIFGGLFWFSYLDLINARSIFAPVYSLFGLQAPAGVATPADKQGDLDADRYAKRLQALDIRSQEQDKKDAELAEREKEVAQISQELDDRLAIIEEKEKSFKQLLLETEDRAANIMQIAKYINGMPPEKSVANLLEMDDQDIIDVLRAVEEIAKKENKTSSVAYWFSLMPANRAADIQRKMANKPASLP